MGKIFAKGLKYPLSVVEIVVYQSAIRRDQRSLHSRNLLAPTDTSKVDAKELLIDPGIRVRAIAMSRVLLIVVAVVVDI